MCTTGDWWSGGVLHPVIVGTVTPTMTAHIDESWFSSNDGAVTVERGEAASSAETPD